MVPSGYPPVVYMSQYDVGRPIGFVVSASGSAPNLDTYTVTLEATRTDGTAITVPVTTSGNVAVFATTATMTNKADKYPANMVIVDSNENRIASIPITMLVVKAAMDENAESIEEDQSLYQQYTEAVQTLIAEIRTDVVDLQDVKVQRFDTVAQMKADTALKVGMYARTGGYYTVNDGGGALYRINSTAPATHYETLTNGLYALLIVNDYITPMMLGGSLYNAVNYATETNCYVLINRDIVQDRPIDFDTSTTIKGFANAKSKTSAPKITFSTFCTAPTSRIKLDSVNMEGNSLSTAIMFDGTNFRGIIKDSVIYNLNFFFKDCILNFAEISDSTIQQCTNFLRGSIIDTTIIASYINGGSSGISENFFMSVRDTEGSSIVGCFVDYYRTMYNSIRTSGMAQMINSCTTEYQVFRYFIYNESDRAIAVSCNGDIFKYFTTDRTEFTPRTATVNNNGTEETISVPPCLIFSRKLLVGNFAGKVTDDADNMGYFLVSYGAFNGGYGGIFNADISVKTATSSRKIQSIISRTYYDNNDEKNVFVFGSHVFNDADFTLSENASPYFRYPKNAKVYTENGVMRNVGNGRSVSLSY